MAPDTIANLFTPVAIEDAPDSRILPSGEPFLSILTRTQGRRSHTLAEVLTCIAAQTDTDFEVLIIGHCLDGAARAEVQDAITDSPSWLRNKIQLILVEDGNRTRPLNAGFAAARGQYVAVLDDDDVVFAHWVETFRKLATAEPSRLLRSVSAQQIVNTVTVQGMQGLRAEDLLDMRYPSKFNFFDHLIVNRSPPVSLAFPRQTIEAHRLTFDETLTTTEDWDFTMRVACISGVAESAEVTSIYRCWDKGESSRSVHDIDEWQANHYRIWDNWNDAPFTLPPGTLRPLIRILEEHAAFGAELRRLRHFGLNDAVAASLSSIDAQAPESATMRELAQILDSTCWRITGPLRWLTVLLGSRPALRLADLHLVDAEQAALHVRQLRESTSWVITTPVRALRRLLGYPRRGGRRRRPG